MWPQKQDGCKIKMCVKVRWLQKQDGYKSKPKATPTVLNSAKDPSKLSNHKRIASKICTPYFTYLPPHHPQTPAYFSDHPHPSLPVFAKIVCTIHSAFTFNLFGALVNYTYSPRVFQIYCSL